MTIELSDGERVDDLNRDGYKIIQNPKRFCFGMDAVLLSGFARVREGERALDMCTGSGVIPILLRAKTAGRDFTGIEIQEEAADMARRSVAMNGLQDSINIITGDIREAASTLGAASFDVVTVNPPYMTEGHGLLNNTSESALSKTIARHELCCTFEDVARESAKCLRPGGRLYLVHRPFRLAEIITALVSHGLEPKRMRLVYPFADRESNMVLMECARGGRPRMTVEKPLIVYSEQGVYTEEIHEIYGH